MWKKEWFDEFNLKVYDDLTTISWIEKDYRDQERQAGVSNARATASKTRIDAGITSPAQELQILVDLDEIPDEFLPEDVTGETLTDEEKPDQQEAAAVEEPEPVEETPQAETQEPTPAETKEYFELVKEMKRANDLLEASLGKS